MNTTSVIALSRSASFNNHLQKALGRNGLQLCPSWQDYVSLEAEQPHVLLIHADLLQQLDMQEVRQTAALAHVHVGIAADIPSLQEALAWLPTGIQAYFNSHMADTHYRHMLEAVLLGQNWISPQVLEGLVGLALGGSENSPPPDEHVAFGLEMLTARELEIAKAVATGMKNRMIAERLGVTERTVKAHLSHIFEKLQVKDRLELAVMMHNRQAS